MKNTPGTFTTVFYKGQWWPARLGWAGKSASSATLLDVTLLRSREFGANIRMQCFPAEVGNDRFENVNRAVDRARALTFRP